MMGHPWVFDLGGGVTLGAFVLPHVPWMAHRNGDRAGVALAKSSMQIIVTLWVWGHCRCEVHCQEFRGKGTLP